MVGKNQVGTVTDVQPPGNLDAGFGERFDFLDKRGGINDHASTDNGVSFRAQDAAGDKLENETVSANDNRVSSIMTSRNTSDVIERTGKIIDDFSFAFIAPLRAYHDDRFHREALLAKTSHTEACGYSPGGQKSTEQNP